MRIVSKFQDYYDSALAYGYDESVVYVRNTMEYEIEETRFSSKAKQEMPPIIKEIHALFKQLRSKAPEGINDWDWRYHRHQSRFVNGFSTKLHNYAFTTIGVLFCGKYFPGVRCERSAKGLMTVDKVDWFYKAEDVLAFMLANGYDAEKEERSRWSKDTVADSVRTFFNDAKQPDVNWLIEHKVTCVVFDPVNNKISINPKLKDYAFFKAVDHYTAFQELDMWISGTLAYPQNMMIELDDKYRVMAHGFDMKYGFRTRPKE